MEEIYFGISAEMLERIEGVNEFIEYIPSEDREMMDRLEKNGYPEAAARISELNQLYNHALLMEAKAEAHLESIFERGIKNETMQNLPC